ncbi:DUF3379 domain-containing protein [Niveibacterium sp. 24ML]|uniref:DUF3379 family protein n=1 Tax=Niveibacterium sp. 24ML TaxID=2985512 RepID=UPI00226EA617|nr:DUF3379 family protein [Niveibacterium sp. 24ML]MCX9158011.1 DUF3379 domain-containing protein [Niveibacterium sp. 24ML]
MNAPTEMNCLAYRRLKLADPQRLSAAARAHEAECLGCESFARRIDAQETRIARTLDVPVPDGLDERILLKLRGQRQMPWRSWAMAASVVLTFGIGITMWRGHGSYDAPRFAIEHVMHEPESFTTPRLADPEQFRTVMAHFGGELTQPIGTVRYMKLCPGPEGVGWHVVLDTAQGMVSLFLIPGDKVRKPQTRTMQGYRALTEPAGQGHFAIVAENDAAVAAMAAAMREKVRWKT